MLLTALLLLPTPAAPPCSLPDDEPSRPNVVLIFADDLGWGDLACYSEQSKIPTPNLDRLAAGGARFTDAHSSTSVCTPSRYALLTGRHAFRSRVPKGIIWQWDPPLLEDERVTLPELLREVGYATACVGKWHLGWDWPLGEDSSVTAELEGPRWPHDRRGTVAARVSWDRPIAGGPLAHGFDTYFGDDVPNFPPYTWIEDDRVVTRPTSQRPKGMFGAPGPAAPAWDLAAVLPALTQRACATIEEHARTQERPLFLYLPLTAPHTPIAPSPRFVGMSAAGAYGDFVCEVDWTVGEVMGSLQRAGIADDTLLLFTSDNGSPARNGANMSGPVGSVISEFGHHPSGPWRGLKADGWEGGHRVPLLARWPGRIEAGRVSDAPVVLTDLFRTLANLVGREVGEHAGEDSYDLAHALWGATDGEPAREVIVTQAQRGALSIRVGRWKLIEEKGSGGFTRWTPPKDAPAGQLYDLEADPQEARNLYREHPEVVAELSSRLAELRRAGRSR